jgi:hypothetical protein
LGIEARARAQVTQGDTAEGRDVEASERLSRTRMHVELAGAHPLDGKRVRRDSLGRAAATT